MFLNATWSQYLLFVATREGKVWFSHKLFFILTVCFCLVLRFLFNTTVSCRLTSLLPAGAHAKYWTTSGMPEEGIFFLKEIVANQWFCYTYIYMFGIVAEICGVCIVRKYFGFSCSCMYLPEYWWLNKWLTLTRDHTANKKLWTNVSTPDWRKTERVKSLQCVRFDSKRVNRSFMYLIVVAYEGNIFAISRQLVVKSVAFDLSCSKKDLSTNALSRKQHRIC